MSTYRTDYLFDKFIDLSNIFFYQDTVDKKLFFTILQKIKMPIENYKYFYKRN